MGLVGRLQWEKSVPGREFPTSAGRGRERGRQAGCRGEMGDVGAGGPDSLQTSSPVRKRNRAASFSALRPSGPYIAGRRPATPQSPERLRSTPFDCVAIAPCCFAKRKAVLSHALAAMTALNKRAGQAVEICAALTALNKCAGQAGREALAAMTALNKNAGQAAETCAAMTALNKNAGQAAETCAAMTALNKSAGQAAETCAALTALNKCADLAVQHLPATAPPPVRSAGKRIFPPWDS